MVSFKLAVKETPANLAEKRSCEDCIGRNYSRSQR